MAAAAGYQGKDVVVENLRSLCVFNAANATGAPWLWWDYASQFAKHCKMEELKFNAECAEPIIVGLGINLAKVQTCMGQVSARLPSSLRVFVSLPATEVRCQSPSRHVSRTDWQQASCHPQHGKSSRWPSVFSARVGWRRGGGSSRTLWG